MWWYFAGVWLFLSFLLHVESKHVDYWSMGVGLRGGHNDNALTCLLHLRCIWSISSHFGIGKIILLVLVQFFGVCLSPKDVFLASTCGGNAACLYVVESWPVCQVPMSQLHRGYICLFIVGCYCWLSLKKGRAALHLLRTWVKLVGRILLPWPSQ